MELNDRIKQARREKNLTLKQVSQGSGISIPYLSDLERGRATPSLETLVTIASFYEQSPQEFIKDVLF
jgi:XRE family transcriptional regulator, regulator of sulfur utilization